MIIFTMAHMSLRQFGDIVRSVLDGLPPSIAEHLHNVVVDVQDQPNRQTLLQAGFSEEEIAEGESLYGLFVPQMNLSDGVDFLDEPHQILIFKNPLEDDFPDSQQLRTEIRKTVIHELAHHFGWSDRDLERFDATENPFEEDL
jgi:predicted Zn-dependent protease with MMP-like domain